MINEEKWKSVWHEYWFDGSWPPGGQDYIDKTELMDHPSIDRFDGKLWFELVEDEIYIQHREKNICVDVGWYPDSDPTGSFGCVVVEETEDGEGWINPLEKLETRNIQEMLDWVQLKCKEYE